MILIESWKKAIDNNKKAGAVFTDLSKAFDSLNHELLLAKLEAYGFDEPSLNFVHSYLADRKQEQRRIMPLALGPQLNRGFHKDRFWDHYFSIFI